MQQTIFHNSLLQAIKRKEFKNWLYEFQHGHVFLLHKEADIIVETRLNAIFNWMNDTQIKKLVKSRIEKMYQQQFPFAESWSWPTLKNTIT